jgi:hypothetical protein
MPGEHPEHQVVALGTPFAVHPDPLPLLGRCPLPQRDVGQTERIEQLDESVGVRLLRVQPVDPEILVVPDDRRLLLRQDETVATRHHDLRVDHVREAFERRPLRGLRAQPEMWAGLGRELAEHRRRRRLHLGWVVVPEETQQVTLIRGRILDRIR